MPNRGSIKSGAKGDKQVRDKSQNSNVVGSESAGASASGNTPEVVVMDETVEEYTCKTCHGPDTEEIVQCDKCDGWYHFSCVGVSDEVADKSWSCTNCITAKWVQRTETASKESAEHKKGNLEQRSSRSQPIGKIVTSTRINPVISPAIETVLAVSTEGVPVTNKNAVFSDAPKEGFPNQQMELPTESVPNVEQTIQKAFSAISISSSQKSAAKRAKLQLMRLDEEREYQKQREENAAQKYSEYLKEKYRILEEAVSETESRSCSEISSRVNEWMENAIQVQQTDEPGADGFNGNNSQRPTCIKEPTQDIEQHRIRFEPSVQVRTPNPLSIYAEQSSYPRQSHQMNSVNFPASSSSRRQPVANLASANASHVPVMNASGMRQFSSERQNPVYFMARPPLNSTCFEGQASAPPACSTGYHFQTNQRGNNDFHDGFQDEFQLSRSQVAARQAVPKDLPTFSGNPEEWPVFLSMYNRTTAMCGFTEEENLVRLQKSLRGKAYEAVKSRLMHPGNILGILSTLKMLFGQPEVIIQSLIGKVSALPAIREEKLDTLVDFAVHVQNFCATVDACGLQDYMYNVTMLNQLVGKLPSSLKLNWAQYRLTVPVVNLATFSAWIYALAEAASVVTFLPSSVPEKSSRNDLRGSKKDNAYHNAHSETSSVKANKQTSSKENKTIQSSTAKQSCLICRANCKSADKCKRFLELSRDSRWAAVREFGLCRTCLRMHKGSCNANPCGKNGCTYRHHELLHNDSKEKSQITARPTESQPSLPSSSNASGCNYHRTMVSSVLFRYVPVVLYGRSGKTQTQAFLDEGSELTLLDQELADELGLDGIERPLCLRWTGGTERCEANSRAYNLQISGAKEGDKRFELKDVRTVKDLMLPQQTLNICELSKQFPHLRNLPIDSYQEVRPRILIGTRHAHLGLVLKNREGEYGQPIAVKSRLGWTVCGGGSLDSGANLHHYSFHICPCNTKSDDDLHLAMKNYFSLDSLGVTKPENPLLSVQDQRALTLLKSLTHRKDGRYESGLLWRYEDTRLPDSRSMAMQRHQCLKKRMEKDSELHTTLQAKITEYIEKGNIRKLTEEETVQQIPRRWYLPIFPVTNPNKPGKVRIVWDADANVHGTSLNSALLKGPDLLRSLFVILLQFRERRIGLTGDIREMFHQVLIRAKDQYSQCFY